MFDLWFVFPGVGIKKVVYVTSELGLGVVLVHLGIMVGSSC